MIHMYHNDDIALSNEAPWCVDSPADIHLSDNVLLVLKQKKEKPILRTAITMMQCSTASIKMNYGCCPVSKQTWHVARRNQKS